MTEACSVIDNDERALIPPKAPRLRAERLVIDPFEVLLPFAAH